MEFGVLGDSIIAWRGPCDVTLDHMVDGEDKRVDAKICGHDMIHFIIEKFSCDLLAAVGFQRLLASIARDFLGGELKRDGDDLWLQDRKLSISVATVSPTSALIHFAVNVTNEGTPVKTLSLTDLGVAPELFAKTILERFQTEMNSIVEATQKVRWVP